MVCCLILLAAVGFLVLQRYAVYGSDGSIRFDLPWKQTEEPSDPSAPDGASRTPDAPDDSPDVIFDEPTRGIDVGAKSEIYKLMSQLAAEGKSIIMISSDMPELLRMSDRIVVMCEGRVTGELDISEATQESIMTFATMREVG